MPNPVISNRHRSAIEWWRWFCREKRP